MVCPLRNKWRTVLDELYKGCKPDTMWEEAGGIPAVYLNLTRPMYLGLLISQCVTDCFQTFTWLVSTMCIWNRIRLPSIEYPQICSEASVLRWSGRQTLNWKSGTS